LISHDSMRLLITELQNAINTCISRQSEQEGHTHMALRGGKSCLHLQGKPLVTTEQGVPHLLSLHEQLSWLRRLDYYSIVTQSINTYKHKKLGFICQALSCCLRYDNVKQTIAVMICLTYFPKISLKGPRRNMKCCRQKGQTMAKQRKHIHDMLVLELRIQ
jgi:hypothetical protein